MNTLSAKPSPFAPVRAPSMRDVGGVRQASMSVGIKDNADPDPAAKPDVLLVAFAEGTTVAGVLTTSKTCAAPVDWCRTILPGGKARGLVVNSGNANAFTGVQGIDLVHGTVDRAARLLGCARESLFVASTGVIGEPIDQSRILSALDQLSLTLEPGGWAQAACAIATTDTFPKMATRRLNVGGQLITLSGYAKGSGMIAPNMATMLCFVYTDAEVPQDALQKVLEDAVETSFHCITVDSDTSTNDTVLLFATGASDGPALTRETIAPFAEVLNDLLLDLAIQVVKDGEGISKFIRVHVEGSSTMGDARVFAMSVANSPLVKTAIAGQDANWGRVIMAIGKAGPDLDKRQVGVRFGDHILAQRGNPVEYDVAAVGAYMKNDTIDITVTVGAGTGQCTVYTSDLTHGYISINADYRS